MLMIKFDWNGLSAVREEFFNRLINPKHLLSKCKDRLLHTGGTEMFGYQFYAIFSARLLCTKAFAERHPGAPSDQLKQNKTLCVSSC